MPLTRDEQPSLQDYELRKTEASSLELPQRRRPAGLWIVVAGLIATTAIAAYIVFRGRTASAPVSTSRESVEVRQQPVRPLGGDAIPAVLPPLDQTDPLVRDLVKQLTLHPRVAAWLATDGLIRNFVSVVSSLAEGRSPRAQLRVLRPSAGFQVIKRDGRLYVDPRSYERYDALAAAAASVDPDGAARVYATLKPRIEEAYRDLGIVDTPFDRTLERAMVLLIESPVVEAPMPAEPRGATDYAFAAPDFEGLPAAQKQLLRMGPRNAGTIQSSLRRIALALGVPAERLPKARSQGQE